jgi:hypothetical protein
VYSGSSKLTATWRSQPHRKRIIAAAFPKTRRTNLLSFLIDNLFYRFLKITLGASLKLLFEFSIVRDPTVHWARYRHAKHISRSGTFKKSNCLRAQTASATLSYA